MILRKRGCCLSFSDSRSILGNRMLLSRVRPESVGRAPNCGGAAWGRRPAEKAFHAQVLVDVGPVNAETGASRAPVRALRRSGGKKSRIPDERHRDGTAVQEIDDQGVLGEPDILDALTRSTF
jgi:hypothetical protein